MRESPTASPFHQLVHSNPAAKPSAEITASNQTVTTLGGFLAPLFLSSRHVQTVLRQGGDLYPRGHGFDRGQEGVVRRTGINLRVAIIEREAMSEVLFTTRSPRRRSRASHRAWRVLSIALIAVGALALLDAGVTLVWQEPFSALYAKFRQDHLNGTLRAAERATPTRSNGARWRACPTSAAGSRSWRASCSATLPTAARSVGS